jgi:hypothetical protein
LHTVSDPKSWLRQKNNIYIGRRTKDLAGSKWGNPFTLEKYSRETSIALYENHIKSNAKLLSSIHELKDKTLGCWCAPAACHGGVLHRLAGNIQVLHVDMGPKKDQSKIINELKQQVEAYKKRFVELESRIEKLESSEAVMKNTTEKLRNELDRLDQYGRRSNLLIRNVEINDHDSSEEDQAKITSVVKNIISKELKLPVDSIDKLHRVGKKKDYQSKKYQNIVVRFKSHHARYDVYRKRKEVKNGVKLNPHLTKRRGTLLHETVEMAEKIDAVDFVYANIHGDICAMLKEEINGTKKFIFETAHQFLEKLSRLNLVELDEDGVLVE